MGGGMVRVLRPTLRICPERCCMTTFPASQAMRRAVSAETRRCDLPTQAPAECAQSADSAATERRAGSPDVPAGTWLSPPPRPDHLLDVRGGAGPAEVDQILLRVGPGDAGERSHLGVRELAPLHRLGVACSAPQATRVRVRVIGHTDGMMPDGMHGPSMQRDSCRGR